MITKTMKKRAEILSGKVYSQAIKDEVSAEVKDLKENHG